MARKLRNKGDRLQSEDTGNTKKRRVRKKYKPQRCAFMLDETTRCRNKAVGKSTLCAKHGGRRVVPEDQISVIDLSHRSISLLKFDPAVHPIQYVQLSSTGMSEVEIAAEFQVAVDTLRTWAEKYKEFGTAYEIGQALHEAWYLRTGKRNLTNPRFQTGLYKFLTGNVLGYSEKVEQRNINQNTHGVLLVPGSMSIDDWEKQNKIENQKRAEAVDAEFSEVIDDEDKE